MQTFDQAERDAELSAVEVLASYLKRPAVFLPLLAGITLVLYSGALSFDFVWDDWPQIVNSPILRDWGNLPRAFTSDLWYHVARHQVYYRPLFVAWSMLNFALFGLKPWGWHLGAILSHTAAVLSVFWLTRRIGLEYWTSAVATAIFALHPVHIEPVVWISAASDSMVTAFVATGFVAFLNGREAARANRTAWWFASLVLLSCALLTKEMAVVFSALVWAYAWLNPLPGKTETRQRLAAATVEAIPYATLTAAYVLLRRQALLHATGQFDPNHGFFDMAKTLPMVIAFYVQKLVAPIGLTGLYYTPYVTTGLLWIFLVPLLAIAGAAGGVWYWTRKERDSKIAFAAIWMGIGLAPALYLRNFGNGDFVRDRYAYLSSVGFAILLAMGCRRLPSIKGWSTQAVQSCAVLALCLSYVTMSLAQQVYWANDLLVLVRGQRLYPGNPLTLAWLSSEYSQRGANDRAIELAKEAAIEHPEYAYGSLALAEAYIRAGRFDEGRVWLEKVNPEYVQSETGAASFAGLYGRIGDYDKAFALCSDILAKEPNLYSALYNCGNVHLLAGQYRDAEQLLTRAVQLAPEQAAPKHFLGRALLEEGKVRQALAYLQTAASMDPKVWDYHYWLGEALEQQGDVAGARAEYGRAVQLNENSKEARMRLTALEAK